MPPAKACRPRVLNLPLLLLIAAPSGLSACSMSTVDRNALYEEILREEARLDEASHRHRHGDAEASQAGCAAAERVCDHAQTLDEEDARLRCAAAERQCANLRRPDRPR